MVRPRRRHINKNPGIKVSRRTKPNMSKLVVPLEAWDKRQTLTQNYERLGLTSRLNSGLSSCKLNKQVNTIQATNAYKQEVLGETDNIFEELDMLNNQAAPEMTPVAVSATASYVPFNEEKPTKLKRHLSANEEAYFQKLVHRYGSDVEAMSRDIKMNYLQMTPGVLRRKLRVFHDDE